MRNKQPTFAQMQFVHVVGAMITWHFEESMIVLNDEDMAAWDNLEKEYHKDFKHAHCEWCQPKKAKKGPYVMKPKGLTKTYNTFLRFAEKHKDFLMSQMDNIKKFDENTKHDYSNLANHFCRVYGMNYLEQERLF